MIELLVNKLLRLLGFKIVKLERGINVRGLFGKKTFNVGNYRIQSPGSHTLSKNLKNHKYYSRNLLRLIDIIGDFISDLEVIDVGANIGDSAVLINSVRNMPKKIYCFEGEKEYVNYFKENTSSMENIVLFETYLGEENSENSFEVFKNNGTLRIDTNKKGNIKIDSIDNIDGKSNNIFNNVKFLKIDTDGYDFKILRGARNLLLRSKPILFFEYDREFLDNVNDDGFSTFKMLEDIGYNKAIIYDNYGRLLISIDIVLNKDILGQLDLYIKNKKGAFPYYDICVFHKEDNLIYNSVVKQEFDFFFSQS
ncbi:MAG: methyltransferase, FkbM family [Bacteroidetes bacterium]|nr:methyltransferase, FkbM family [Bacteroidota bacterium]